MENLCIYFQALVEIHPTDEILFWKQFTVLQLNMMPKISEVWNSTYINGHFGKTLTFTNFKLCNAISLVKMG